MGSNQQPFDSKSNALPSELRREICGMGFNFYCTVLYIATMLHLTAEPRVRPSSCIKHVLYHIIFIKTENIAVDEIGRIICSHLLARAQSYFYRKLLCMHDAMTCYIVAIL